MTLRKSKTNQQGNQEIKAIPNAKLDEKYCPVRHLTKWLDISGISDGPVFRCIRRNQKLGDELLTGDGFYKLLKKLCNEAGIESKQITPHSLRAGFITSAYLATKQCRERYLVENDRRYVLE